MQQAPVLTGGNLGNSPAGFLQGLLLCNPDEIPDALRGLRDPVASFQRVAAQHGLRPLEAALGFALRLPEIAVVLCGVQNLSELDALLAAAQRSQAVDPAWFSGLRCADVELLDPSAWPALA